MTYHQALRGARELLEKGINAQAQTRGRQCFIVMPDGRELRTREQFEQVYKDVIAGKYT